MSSGQVQPVRVVRIGMPQMAVGCLSENWLLKELGSFHWDCLCDSLRRKSHELTDSEGRRLYATFVRVCLSLDGTLANFHEGDELRLSIEMTRFGRSSLLSTIRIESNVSSGTAALMSTFSLRTDANNTSLVKSAPVTEFDCSIGSLLEAPRFFTEYSEIRKRYGKRSSNELVNLWRDDGVSATYQINPFIDSNGANLLYFSSYQSIHDFLLSLHLSNQPQCRDVRFSELHTKCRDIFYFRNCDLGDKINLAAVSSVICSSDCVQSNDILLRHSDGESIAFISTVKNRG